MNPELITAASSRRASQAARPARRLREPDAPELVILRASTSADVPAIHALIQANLDEGHLLPRSIRELEQHVGRFIVAVERNSSRRTAGRIVACAELAPLSAAVAEVRSLVVHPSVRARGIGRRLVDELRRMAAGAGYESLCAFTHDAAYFVRRGFSIVPHQWIPEKIALDCSACPLFRRCGQYAVRISLND
jgi:amino-acid N-acetyltransferase